MNAVAVDEAKLLALVEAAERAQNQGQTAEAQRLLSQARSEAPEHPIVLGAYGVHALRLGNTQEARDLLERAIERNSQSPGLYLNLAAALHDLNQPDAEMAALQQAIELDPYFSLAIFQKASLLEHLGKKKLAAGAYHAALSSLRPGSQIPYRLQPLIEHAQRCVQANSRDLEEWLRQRMQDVRARHATAAQDRVDDCLAALLGKKRIYVQQPTFMHFPRLPAIPFFEREDFAWLPEVEAATASIRDELSQLLADSIEEFAPYVTHAPDAPLNQWKELNHSRRWSALFLLKDGARLETHIARCPKTMAALELAPQVNIPHRAPTAFFSRLEPKTRIPPHTGVSNSRLTVHIPLIVPPNCGFRVGSDIREWQPGTALVFDDTIEHEAWNNSGDPRVILIFDIWNPLLTPAERDLIEMATVGVAEFYDEGPVSTQSA